MMTGSRRLFRSRIFINSCKGYQVKLYDRIRRSKKRFSDIELIETYKKGYVKWAKIKCPIHGVSEKRYYDLMRSEYGCPKCGYASVDEKRYKKPFSDFLKKAYGKFGDRFVFLDKKEYYYDNETISAVCPVHGNFKRKAGSFLKSLYGCPECGRSSAGQRGKLTTNEVVKKLQKERGREDYDFSKTKWIDSEHDIEVICKTHGAFLTRYNDFIRGIDCPKCAIEKRRLKEEQKLRSFLIDRYKDKIQFPEDFNYVNGYTPVKILYCGEEVFRTPSALKNLYYCRRRKKRRTELIEESKRHKVAGKILILNSKKCFQNWRFRQIVWSILNPAHVKGQI